MAYPKALWAPVWEAPVRTAAGVPGKAPVAAAGPGSEAEPLLNQRGCDGPGAGPPGHSKEAGDRIKRRRYPG